MVEKNMHRLVEDSKQYISVPSLGPELGMKVIEKLLQVFLKLFSLKVN